MQAESGRWREAAPGLIDLASHSTADVYRWLRGAVAALGTSNANAYSELCMTGRSRFAGSAEAETAWVLFRGLILRPQAEDVSHTLPELLRRVEEGQAHSFTAANLLFLRSEMAYRKGEFEEALRFLDAWANSIDERPVNIRLLQYTKASALPDFWRAMVTCRLGQLEEARHAYSIGFQKLRAGFTPDFDTSEQATTYYASRALQQEARGVLESSGIALSDTEVEP